MGLFSQRAEVCLIYDQVIFQHLSPYSLLTHSFRKLMLHMQPLCYNENTQVVTGGESVEGEYATSFQGNV